MKPARCVPASLPPVSASSYPVGPSPRAPFGRGLRGRATLSILAASIPSPSLTSTPWNARRLRRFAVRIESPRGDEHSYLVTTWRSEAKAVALAVARHRALGRGHIYDVQAEGLGTVEADRDGNLEAPEDDLVDPYEW